ncbi:adhesion G protein-coupled receptor E1 isoform X2 [Lemur catta]|nr:adhesion G protein-coupled receptor E1 isoform X2 [Lemur catta]
MHTVSTVDLTTMGLNACAYTTTCPAYATCTTTTNSYYCTCKRGFRASNGQMQFKDPGVKCNDIDECSQSPPVCGLHAVCENMKGKYKCSCLPGFSSPTGNSWNPGKPGRFACTDIDECLTSGVCPEHSHCANSVGSYSCNCQVGFIASKSTCEDVDECSQSPPICGPHSVCENMLGTYKCSCLPGFSSPTGNGWIWGKPGHFSCTDVDECSQSPPICGPHSVCENMPGTYKCSCLPGFSSPTGNGWIRAKPGQFACTDIDECLTSGVCPEHSHCANSVGSYSCNCQVGFIASKSTCEDVDECSQSPPICGPHSVCENMPGTYKCSCLPGFSSPTGNGWIRAKPGQFACTDIDECLTSGVCPEHSHCANSVGSYSCNCQVGFIASKSTCEDVDECSQSPQICGPHSVCENMLGTYKCSCLPGFSSPTGNGWIPGKPGHFACTEVNECANPRACPENATCYNTLGNYSCVCNRGFESSSGSLSFQGVGGSCEDVDECSRNSTLCGPNSICINVPGAYSCSCLAGFFSPNFWTLKDPGAFECVDIDECAFKTCPVNATCTNTPGSYFCTCHPGFVPSNRQTNFTDQKVKCRDIDECFQDPSLCGPHSVCTNALGSYSCSCMMGFRPDPERFQKYGNLSCKRLPFKCMEDVIPNNKQVQQCQGGAALKPEYVSFCALINAIFSILNDVCENKTTVVSLKSTAKSLAPVLERVSTSSKFTKEKMSALGTVVLQSVESTVLAALLDPSANVSQTIRTENLDIESKVINEECTKQNIVFNLKAKGDEMKVGCSIIKESASTGTTGVAFVSFVGMEAVLDERFFHGLQTPLADSKTKLKINSRVIGGIMTGEKKKNFSDPVVYTLENIKPKQELESPICVSWSTDVKGGRWTTSGCVVQEASETHTVCRCNRMVNLAVIMASGELTMEFSLYVISHVGMIISLVCLILAIATFLLCRSIQNRNTYLHLNLCICLFLAEILFLIGIDKTENQMGCAIIAGALHYLFLACFFWMLVEAVLLFLMVRNLKVVNYFGSHNVKLLYLCAFSYGLPALLVFVSASVQPKGYGMDDRCWLDAKTGFIWSFLGPVCVIITVNFVLLTWTLCILRQKLSSVNAEVSTLKDTRLLTFKAFAQLFVLGCSWVLGLFQIGPIASVMAYLFTIINSLQGAFIFLIHCLLSRQVREEYRRWITRKTKPSSQSQSSVILLSSVPSTSKTG